MTTVSLVRIFRLLSDKGETYLTKMQIAEELGINPKTTNRCLRFLRQTDIVELLDIRPQPYYRLNPQCPDTPVLRELKHLQQQIELTH